MATDVSYGINIAGIPKLIAAIDAYQKAINEPYVGMSEKTLTKYIKGDKAKAALVQYFKALDKEAASFTKTLDNLEQSLNELKTAYEKQDASAAGNVNTATTKLKS